MSDESEAEASAALARSGRFVRVGDWYANHTLARASINAIPYLGGTLDVLLSGGASKRSEARILALIDALKERLAASEKRGHPVVPLDEELAEDWLRSAFIHVARRGGANRLQRIAAATAGQVLDPRPWSLAERLLELAADLSDLEHAILEVATSVEEPAVVKSVRSPTITFGDVSRSGHPAARYLPEVLPAVDPEELRLGCIFLLNHGLLADTGPGKLGVGPHDQFAPTRAGTELVAMLRAGGDVPTNSTTTRST